MNVLIFDKPGHLISFHAKSDWLEDFFLCPLFLEPTGIGRKLKLKALKILGERGKLDGYSETDISSKAGLTNLTAEQLELQKDYGLAIIDCVNKNMVALSHEATLDHFTFLHVDLYLDPKFYNEYTKPKVKKYHELLNSGLLSGSKKDMKLLASRIDKYTQKGVVSRWPKRTFAPIVFTVDPQFTGWTTHSNGDYRKIENYKKLNDVLLTHSIVLSPEQQANWQTFADRQTHYGCLKLDFFEAQRIEKEKKDLLDVVKNVAPSMDTPKPFKL